MTSSGLRDFYEKNTSLYSASLQAIRKKINLISNVRLAVAVVFIAVGWFGFSHPSMLYALPAVLLLFIVLVRRHSLLFDEKLHLENLLFVQQNEIRSLDGDFSKNSSGSEFINVHHPYTHDLDIFGEGSVFQYINRASTSRGKKVLAKWLSSKPELLHEILSRQQSIRELSEKKEFRHQVQAWARQIDEQPDDLRQLEEWCAQRPLLFGKPGYRLMLHALPALTVTLLLCTFFVDWATTYALLAAGSQWVITGFHLKRVNAFHQYVSRKKNILEKYAKILSCIRAENYSSSLLLSLRAQAGEADSKVKQLASLVAVFDARLNTMTNLVVNALFLYDLQCVYRLERWKEENARNLSGWLAAVPTAEALCSLGTFAFNHPRFCFPEIAADLQLSAKALGHPLIDDKVRVPNDVHMDHTSSIMIITGANMAGKSTFLRSLGVNVVLALSGGPVCAASFRCPLIQLRSGMRTTDSLIDNQSYFFAELYRLKSIMDELRNGTPLLILLDEILKGTNSTDKQAGSYALIKQFAGYPCLALIATHDLGLSELEKTQPRKITNYCFEATIEGDQLSFDYKLKRGVAQKMNATFLMRKMGIIAPSMSAEEEHQANRG